MMSDVPTNAEKQDVSNSECAYCQRNTNDLTILLAQMTLCIMMLRNFPPFIRPSLISDGPTNGMSIRQLSKQF